MARSKKQALKKEVKKVEKDLEAETQKKYLGISLKQMEAAQLAAEMQQ